MRDPWRLGQKRGPRPDRLPSPPACGCPSLHRADGPSEEPHGGPGFLAADGTLPLGFLNRRGRGGGCGCAPGAPPSYGRQSPLGPRERRRSLMPDASLRQPRRH